MRKLSKQIAVLEGLKSESSIGNVREILSLAAKVLGTEMARSGDFLDLGPLMLEFVAARDKAEAKAFKLMKKKPDMTFDELVRKVCKR